MFVCFNFLRPINNLSVIKGLIFLGWASTELGLMFLLKDTTQWHRWGSNPQPLGLESSTLQLSHCAPVEYLVTSNNQRAITHHYFMHSRKSWRLTYDPMGREYHMDVHKGNYRKFTSTFPHHNSQMYQCQEIGKQMLVLSHVLISCRRMCKQCKISAMLSHVNMILNLTSTPNTSNE